MAIGAYEYLSDKQRINYLKFSETQSLSILEDIRDDQVVKSILLAQIAKLNPFLSA
jgi:hypothetical protein